MINKLIQLKLMKRITQLVQKKIVVDLLDQRTKKINLVANNVVQKCNVLAKKGP
jgi:hypothetical protein